MAKLIFTAGNSMSSVSGRGLIGRSVRVLLGIARAADRAALLVRAGSASAPFPDSRGFLAGAVDYKSLYNKYFTKIDQAELAAMINGFLASYSRSGESDFQKIKAYFFATFMDYWCQIVDFGRDEIGNNGNEVCHIGAIESAEFQIFSKISSPLKPGKATTYNLFTVTFLRCVNNLFSSRRKKRELDPDSFLLDFAPSNKGAFKLGPKTIVIGILEERRYARIAELKTGLEAAGYDVLLFCSMPKTETLHGLKKFPELERCLVRDCDILSQGEAKAILLRSRKALFEICDQIGQSEALGKFTYRGVPLFQIAWNDIAHMICLRGMQAALNSALVEKLLSKGNVAAFIGMDDSVSTSVWMSECQKRGIASFFHLYNAARSPVIYRLHWECFLPSEWLLGGSRQKDFFLATGAPADRVFRVTGDLFADSIAHCDREAIRRSLREKLQVPPETKVAVLVSSYVVAEFTEERKRILFVSVAAAAKAQGIKLVIKAHPNERLDLLKSQMAGWGVEAPVFHTESIRDVLLAADMMCMYFSEAAQQAMLIGVPVLAVFPPEMMDVFDAHWDYFSSGSVEYVALGKDLGPAVKGLVFDAGNREKQIQRAYSYSESVLGNRDGKNASRFVAAVREFIAQNAERHT